MRFRTAFIAPAVLALLAAGTDAAPFPSEVQRLYRLNTPPAKVAPGKEPANGGAIDLLLDGSMSMAGYAKSPDPNRQPLGDIVAVVEEMAQTEKAPIRVLAFGTELAPVVGDPARWGRPAPYTAKESRIDVALKAMRDAPPGAVSVLVSDLWFDNKSFTGAPAVALGQPLRAILADGRTVAVVGIRAPFQGVVYGMPGSGNYAGASERALLLVLSGPEVRVRKLVRRLMTQSPSFQPEASRPDKVHVTYFRLPGKPRQLAPPKALGAGIKTAGKLDGLSAFEMDWSEAKRPSKPGRLAGVYDLANVLPKDMAWRGPVQTKTRLWRETGGTWQPYPLIGKTWGPRPSKPGAMPSPPFERVFAFVPSAVKSLPEGRYLLMGEIGTDGIASPDAAATWMRDWSLPANPGKPAFVRALGLDQLARILENATSSAAPIAGFAVMIEIED